MILSVVVGSRAYGLAGPDSDHDRRGVFVTPTRAFWSLDKPPTHRDGPRDEEFSWEIERFCTLALQANPTVLEVLWSPLVETITDEGERLVAARRAFLSRRVAQTYGSYAQDQLAKVHARQARTGEIKRKHVTHLLRLLMAGAHVLRTGEVLLDVSAHRERLLGLQSWESWAAALTEDLDAAAAETRLPPEPDRALIDQLLIGVRERGLQ